MNPTINNSETLDQVVERLAHLPILERYLIREPESEKLSISPAELEYFIKIKLNESTTEQETGNNGTPALMNPDDLAQCIKMIVNQYTVLEEEDSIAITLWIIFTWLHEHASFSPILNISSPEKRCGKTTVLTVLTKMCSQPMLASNISPAALYRVIEKDHPTLVIDEADTFVSNSSDLRGIINSGHSPESAYVIRCTGDSHDAVPFSTWCPKVFAGIGDLPETVMDRSIIIEMKRKLPSQKIDGIRRTDSHLFEAIQEQLALFSSSIADDFKGYTPDEISELNDRANNNWEPLLGIAYLLGDDWLEKANISALKLSVSQEDTLSSGEELLTDIYKVLLTFNSATVATKKLIAFLCEDDERPWEHWNKGSNITAAQLSKMLKPFHIKPSQFRAGNKQMRGYHCNDFSDAINRYVPQTSVTDVTDVTDATVVRDVTGILGTMHSSTGMTHQSTSVLP